MAVLLTACTSEPRRPAPQQEPPQAIQPTANPYQRYIDQLAEDSALNEDCVARLVFDSQIINLPVVQGPSNDTYLRTDWQTMEYSIYGSVFMDYRNTFADQNIIIYGHYSYPSKDPDRVIMFTPLEQLIKQENYEQNKDFSLITTDCIRRYRIVASYYCPLHTVDGYQYTDDSLQYYHTQYDADYFDVYHDAVLAHAFYSTGEDFTLQDNIITLQTCVYNRDDLRQIVIAKQIDNIPY